MENNSTKAFNFYKPFVFLFITISAFIFLLERFLPAYYNTSIWLAQIFYFIITLITHFISAHGLNKKHDFHIFYLGSMAIRFLLSLIFIFVVFFNSKENPVIFVVAFFLLYLIYTSFEIYFLLRNLRTDLKNDGTITKTR